MQIVWLKTSNSMNYALLLCEMWLSNNKTAGYEVTGLRSHLVRLSLISKGNTQLLPLNSFLVACQTELRQLT